MTCFLQLGWRFPEHVYDLHTAYLSVSNILLPYNPDEIRKKPRKRLSDACRAYGIEGWEKIDKPEMAKAIGEGRWREYGQPAVLRLLRGGRSQLGGTAAASARGLRQLRARSTRSASCTGANTAPRPSPGFRRAGMPIDMPLWNLVQENKAAVIGALIARFDPSQGSEYPIYSPEGEWSSWRFEHWLVAAGITEWPRLDSGALQLDGDAFRMMYGAHPAIEGLHALRDSSRRHRARPDPDRPRRSQPSEPVSVRHRHRPQCPGQEPVQRPRQHALVHEVSGRQDRALSRLANPGSRRLPRRAAATRQLAEDYLSGDIYHALARMCGLTNAGRQALEGDTAKASRSASG